MKIYCSICGKLIAEITGKIRKGAVIIGKCKECMDGDIPEFFKDIFKK